MKTTNNNQCPLCSFSYFTLDDKKLLEIKNETRNPVENLSDIPNVLNKKISGENKNNFEWTTAADPTGPCLELNLSFSDPKKTIAFLGALNDLQEATDHHTSLKMTDLNNIRLRLNTHHPVPCVSQVDLFFANYLTDKVLTKI